MKKFFLILMVAFNVFAADATIEIIKDMQKKQSIAVQEINTTNINENLKNKFFKMLIADLRVSANFNVIEQKFFGHDYSPILIEKKPDLVIKYEIFKDNANLNAKVFLVDFFNQNIRYEKTYQVNHEDKYPFLSHEIVSDLSSTLNLAPVDWMQKYVILSRYTQKKQSEIMIADYTLTYQKTIVKGGLNVFPKWANQEQSAFYYTSYNHVKPTLYHVNLNTGERKQVLTGSGLLIVSSVSKDASKILVTTAPNDQADIYEFNLITKKLTRLTFFSGIDVGGNYVENDTAIVFISDRLGYPNVFYKKLNQRAVSQMVYFGRNNNSASSFNNYIVYSSRETKSTYGRNTFNLYLISTKTDYVRQLTGSGKNLFPRFSSDGQSILYIKELSSQSAIGIIRLGVNKSFHYPLNFGKIQSLDW